MTGMFGGGGYVQPDSRVLSSITESPNPTAADYADQQKFVETVQRHDYAIKALAQQTQQLQKGVNDATQNPLQQIQQFLADVVILMGGGQLAEGALDFGDLQYILPVLGALFGIGDGPFPLDLFAAAERFFLGYVVPTKQFTDVINTMIGAWMTVFGIDPKFVKDTKALITAIGQLFGEVGNLLPNLNTFFGALGGGSNPGGASLGPLGAALGPIIKLFAGINLAEFGNAIEFITSAIDPFIVQLTAIINFVNEVLAVLGSGVDVVNDPLPQVIVPFQNLIRMLGNINLAIDSFNPLTAAEQFIARLVLPVSSIGATSPDVQTDSAFSDAASVAPYGEWVWDVPGHAASGSATVHADGTLHALLGTPIPVTPGQVISVSAWAMWSGLSASGSPIALGLKTDTAGNVSLASVASPGASHTWTQLSGSWTVPSGVTLVRTRLVVDTGATAGQVWFDDSPITRTNLLPQSLVQNLETNLLSLLSISTWQGFLDQAALAIPGAGTIAAVISRLTGLDLSGAFDAAQLRNIANIPQIAATSIAGLAADLQANLTSILAALNTLIGAFQGSLPTNPLTGIETQIQSAAGGFLNAITQAATGAQQIIAADTAIASNALAGILGTLGALGAQVSGLALQVAQVASGTQVGGTAPAPATGWPNFTLSGSGAASGTVTSGGYALQQSGNVARTLIGIHNTALTSDYQAGRMMLKSLAQGGDAGNSIVLRANALSNPTTFVELREYPTRLDLIAHVSGTPTVMHSTSLTALKAGLTYELDAGTAVSKYQFIIRANGHQIDSYTDSGPVSHLGNLWAGMAEYSDVGSTVELSPGVVEYIASADNDPVGTQGTGLRVSNTRSTSMTWPATPSNTGIPPANWWNSLDEITSDIAWDPVNSIATVQKAGWYVVKVAVPFLTSTGTYLGATDNPTLLIGVGGNLVELGCPGPNGATLSGMFDTFGPFYARAGDDVQVGYTCSGSHTMAGGGYSVGFETASSFMTMAKVG